MARGLRETSRFGLIRPMVAGDRSALRETSMHCLWRTIVISRESEVARRTWANLRLETISTGAAALARRGYLIPWHPGFYPCPDLRR